MRGTERPAQVQWTRPFLLPLKSLDQGAARQTFIDIAEDRHNPDEVDKILSLTDNMPLAIDLIAHVVDLEGCSNVLSRWNREKTSLISDGYDRRSNLELSILVSLSSPRLKSVPHSQDLLSLLSILPDGLSHVELVQSKLPIDDILGCQAVLIRTALAYRDEQKRLKALLPIREYMHKVQPPGDHLVRPLLKHFQKLVEFYAEYGGTQLGSGTVTRIASNLANIQNILRHRLQQGDPDLVDNIYCACYLNEFSRYIGHGTIPWIVQLHNMFPQPQDHRLETYFTTELLRSRDSFSISNLDRLVSQALEHLEQFDDPDVKCMPR
jgi:hypothetical protein